MLGEADAKADILASVREAVSRFGTAGTLVIEGNDLVLYGAGSTARCTLSGLPQIWASLGADERQRRANELARGLTTQRRSSAAPGAPVVPARARVWTLPSWVTPLAVGVALLGVYGLSQRFIAAREDAAARAQLPARSSAETYELERTRRAQRVCEETRARVVRGATVATTDVDGWVVELSLLRPAALGDFKSDRRLSEFIADSADAGLRRIVWAEVPELTALSSPATFVEVTELPGLASANKSLQSLAIRFSGRYVVPYFAPEDRTQFIRLASALATRLEATHAALYAHCAESTAHHLGSWFRGNTPADAVAALIVFMGTYADVSQVRLPSSTSPDAGQDRELMLTQIRDQAHSLDRMRIARLLGEQGGMITGRGNGETTLSFEFRDGNRASRASLALARKLGIANDGSGP